MHPITSIIYDGRTTFTITGPAKMRSYMTVSREFAYLTRLALSALNTSAPDTHKIEINRRDVRISWQYTAYFGD